MGFSVISHANQRITVTVMDCLKLTGIKDSYTRLQLIHEKVTELIESHRPDSFAIEAPFFGKNVQSMLKLGRAQGVAIAAALQRGLPIYEYAPKKVKQSITGNGNADKEQVWKMLQQLLQLKEVRPASYDASDALAVAVCHYFEDKKPVKATGGKARSWADFIKQEPGRVKRK